VAGAAPCGCSCSTLAASRVPAAEAPAAPVCTPPDSRGRRRAGPSQVGVATRTFAPVAAPGGRRRLRALGDLTELTVSVVPTPANVRGRLP